MRLYNGKWDNIWDNDKYNVIRNKIRDAFKDLVFYEGPHEYYLGDRKMTCVSDVTHMFKEEFDSQRIAEETFERNFDNPNSKYYRMTVEEILEAWKDNSRKACEHGTERHSFAEGAFYFMTRQYDLIPEEFKCRVNTDEEGNDYYESEHYKEDAVVRFYTDIPICFVPIMAEAKVFVTKEEYAYSGTFDLLMYYDATLDDKDDSKSGLVVMDWKTNKDLYKNFGNKTLLSPFDDFLDMSLSIYKIQLSAYQHCLENIGLKVIARRILWLLPDGTYNKIPTESLVKLLLIGLKIKHREGKI